MSISVVSPREQTQFKFDTNSCAQASVEQSNNVPSTLNNIGFTANTKIADSLQGSIYRASATNIDDIDDKSVVIKVTNRYLHNHSLAMVGGKMYACNENIVVESGILKYLTQQPKCPPSIVKFHSLIETDNDYLFVMEDGGQQNLFEFIQKVHSLIKKGQITITHWRDVCKIIFKQMIECIAYIHSHNIIHFDISLQNFLINDIDVKVTQADNPENDSFQFELDDIQIKLCDFGLSRVLFADTKSKHFVGKSNYKSPEVCNKQEFDGKANDVWCVGICLFSLISGSVPFEKAVETDDAFKYIMKYNKMRQLLNAWNILHYFDDDSYDLIARFLQYEQSRIDLVGINKHPWLN